MSTKWTFVRVVCSFLMLHAVLDKERGAVHESDLIHAQPLRLRKSCIRVG
ncbi:hypothetical protein SELSPUOL_02158 [Selenomonas sputigena ATCC 35185]|uniref:Uncharacterized protein n=1 Tax=Selenomonas sputigena (strain ATCC 35185 / DSM 20758 / CCUG 44933 / VPI D19B-28) TaxID=546271 RepID=C9LXF0_SELS3|nr:hypothetical protein SELSPUOL_02158 [Selenomonas sputigena ATCC 35185]